MGLDIFTIIVACSAALVLLGGGLVFFWFQDRRSVWLLWWGLPLVLAGASLSVYMRPAWDADIVGIIFGNAARIATVSLLWQGARVFERRPPALMALAGLVSLWLALCLIPAFRDSVAARLMTVSLLNGLSCALAAFEFWRGRDERLASRWPIIVILLSFSALMLIRVAFASVLPFPMGTLPMESGWMAALVLAVFAHATFIALLFLSITKERREAEQRRFSLLDPLTGLMNRRAFMDHAERASRRRNFSKSSTALLVLDLDDFKHINDRFGHEVGDRMLAAFSAEAETNVRPNDQLYRMGGEEFCFVLPDTSLADALLVAERIRKGFEAVRLHGVAEPVMATVSIGVATTTHSGFDLEVLLNAADAAVYEAKARGRNRIVVNDPAMLRRPAVVPLARRAG